MGAAVPDMRSELLKQILKGKCIKDTIKKRIEESETKKPITADILKLVKACISKLLVFVQDQRLIWFSAPQCFLEHLEFSILLQKNKTKYDPRITLSAEDVR